MTRHERLLERYEDALFALLMEDVMLREGERLEALNEKLLRDPAAAVPESLDRRCEKAIGRRASAQRRRSALRRTGKILRAAAVIVALAATLFTTAFAVSEEFRAAAVNLVLTVTPQYTQFEMQRGEGPVVESREGFAYFQNVDIQWLPEGLSYVEGEYDWYASFERENGEWIKIMIYGGHGSLNIDTEQADRVEKVSINGNEGLCVFKDDYIHIVTADLENDLYIDVLASNKLPEEDVKKVAENLFIRGGQAVSVERPASAQYFENAEIGWLPEGFAYKGGTENYSAEFENASGEYVNISVFSCTSSVFFDTEDAGRVEPVTINGYEGLCVVKQGEIRFYAADLENRMYLHVDVSETLGFDVARRIVENLRIFTPPDPAGDELFENVNVTWLPEGYRYADGLYGRFALYEDNSGEDIRDYVKIVWFYGPLPPSPRSEGAEEAAYGGYPGWYYEGEDVTYAVVTFPDCYVSVQCSGSLPVRVARRVAENLVLTGPARKPSGYDTGRGYLSGLEIGWLPEGYQYEKGDQSHTAEFSSAFGQPFMVNLRTGVDEPAPETYYDVEDIRRITIGGKPAVCYLQFGWPMVVVMDRERDIQIEVQASFAMPMEAAIRVAEHVTALDDSGKTK